MDRIELMRAFVRVVETGSLSRAAKELRTTQPTVSKWMRRLEDSVGARLLQRNTRGVRLTDGGEAYFEGARRIVAEVEGVESAVRRTGRGVCGRLSLNFPVGLGAMYLTPFAFELQAKHPGLFLRITATDRVVDLVQDGVDLAVRLGGVFNPSLVARPLGSFSFVLVAAPAYLAARGRPRTVEELQGHNYLVYGDERTEVLTTPRGPERVRITTDLEMNSHLTLRSALLAGRGVGRAVRWLVQEDVDAGRLEVVLPGCAPPPFVAHLVYLPARPQPEKLKAAVAHFSERVKTIPGWVKV